MTLASILKIENIRPIPEADRIEQANVLGYNVVIKKGEFKEGDYCVFFYPDTVVDNTNPVFSFLDSKQYRIKQVKFRGVRSQGLALPLSSFGITEFSENQDVTELTKTKKYELPITQQLESRGGLPHFIRRTDEENILKYKRAVEELAGKSFYISLKCDGSSFSAYLRNGEFGVCSRSLELKRPVDYAVNNWWKMVKKYNLEEKMKEIGGNFAIQGEVVGPGINGNKMKFPEHDLYVFDIWDINNQQYFGYSKLLEVCNKMSLKHVPILKAGLSFADSLETLQDAADILDCYEVGRPGVKAEGMVVRGKDVLFSSCLNGRLSVKVINNNY